jgi:hypothetical protein
MTILQNVKIPYEIKTFPGLPAKTVRKLAHFEEYKQNRFNFGDQFSNPWQANSIS